MVLILSIVLALFLPSPLNIVVIVLGVIGEIGEVIWGRRLARRWRPQTGPETLVGKRATVVTACRPRGNVRVNGEIWAATCAEGADAGEKVRVARVHAEGDRALELEVVRAGKS
jgi:membrane protein implicated in regulation of membrane protease activity